MCSSDLRQMMSNKVAVTETEALVAQTGKLIIELENTLSNEPERVASDVNMVNNPDRKSVV